MDNASSLEFLMQSGVTATLADAPVPLRDIGTTPAAAPAPAVATASGTELSEPKAPAYEAGATTTTATSPAQASKPAAPQHHFATGENALTKAKEAAAAATTREELQAAIENFKELSICKTATNTVFCDGNPNTKLMVLGEAPGANEDVEGIPFCGESGKVLDKFLHHIGYSRAENAYISNVVFWRPPGNRKPTPEEIELCRPFFTRHIALMQPEAIICVGSTPANALLQNNVAISKLRGQPHSIEVEGKEIPVYALFHPSYLLRQPQKKRLFWEDLLAVKLALQPQSA